MRICLIMTVMTADRPGLVKTLSETISQHDGSWLESRMARLAGQFTGLLRIDCPQDRSDDLAEALESLEGMTIHLEREAPCDLTPHTQLLDFDIVGNDRPGIVRSIADAIAPNGANVEELQTSMESAPMAGHPLFHVRCKVSLSPDHDLSRLIATIENLGEDLAVTIER